MAYRRISPVSAARSGVSGKLLVVAYTTGHPVGLDSAQMFLFSHGALTPVESPLRARDWLTPQVYEGTDEGEETEEYS